MYIFVDEFNIYISNVRLNFVYFNLLPCNSYFSCFYKVNLFISKLLNFSQTSSIKWHFDILHFTSSTLPKNNITQINLKRKNISKSKHIILGSPVWHLRNRRFSVPLYSSSPPAQTRVSIPTQRRSLRLSVHPA